MNRSVDPCVDFYQYACGNWIASNPLPADRSRWGRFTELSSHNERVLIDILQGAAAVREGRAAIDQKVGDYFTSCMDTSAIDRRGLAPLEAALARIRGMETGNDVEAEIAQLHRIGVQVIFQFGAAPDAKDSSRTIASLNQGGLSLADRDYYLKTDAKSVETRARFTQHVARMFQLAGDSTQEAADKAKAVLEMETILARASTDRVALRDPNQRYHPMTVKELSAIATRMDWPVYFQAIGAPAFDSLNVVSVDFLKGVTANLPQDSTEPYKALFEYQLLRSVAEQLPAKFAEEHFDFFQRYLGGVKDPRPRTAQCSIATDRALGDLLGQKYVELAFGADARKQIAEMVDALEKAVGRDIQSLPWMTAPTKKAALEKLKAIVNNVGAPQSWRDYSKVTIARDDYYGNTLRAAESARERTLGRIGQPTDKRQWTMTTPTVNAFYSPPANTINFPAGILQPPFFDPRRDLALNYGAAGAVIGHEITHGFDDQGRKYDGNGNVRDWWTPQDAAEFEKRAACLVNEYSGFTAVDDLKLNGKLTLGENTADNGGVRVALMALHDVLRGKQDKVEGFTPEQRFFLGYAQIWCENSSPESKRQRALTDPHSQGLYRVNGVLRNMTEFQQAFSCKAGQPMVSENMCRVW